MAKANKYPVNQKPSLQDIVFGSKAEDGKDQNITIESILSVLKIAFGNDSVIYKYSDNATFLGCFTANEDKTNFAFNKKETSGVDLSLLFNKLKTLTSLVLKLTNLEDVNNFYALRIMSITENDSTFIITTESYKNFSSGELISSKNYSLVFDIKEDAYYGGVPYPTITIGGVGPSYLLSGKTPAEILEKILVVYQSPMAINFYSSDYQAEVEVGTTITGLKTFYWTILHPENITANSGSIINGITNSALVSGFAPINNTITNVAVNTYKLGVGERQEWFLRALNTNGISLNSNVLTTRAYFKRFYGSTTAVVTDSTTARNLPYSAFQIANASTFILNTNTDKIFTVLLPPGVTISAVLDLSASNVNITSQYILKGTISVNDIGGTSRTYNHYEMTQAVAYSTNHQHQITTN